VHSRLPCVPWYHPDASYYDAGADGFEVDDELVRLPCLSKSPLPPLPASSHRISVPVPPSPAHYL
jgi:hypothetical protein